MQAPEGYIGSAQPIFRRKDYLELCLSWTRRSGHVTFLEWGACVTSVHIDFHSLSPMV
jgi:hypothetical protein